MSTPEGNPTVPVDPRETVVSPRQREPEGELPTIDLRDTVSADQPVHTVDLRDTVLVPAQAAPTEPPSPPVELLRFGPGVPAVIATTSALTTPEKPVPPRRGRRDRALNLGLTLALVALVVWWLWPSGALRVRSVTVKAAPGVVACEQTADVVATVLTNGNAGRLTYRWTRNDGIGSGTLVQSLARGQHSVNLHLTWVFHGPGSYAARATVQLLTPGTSSATVNFQYVC